MKGKIRLLYFGSAFLFINFYFPLHAQMSRANQAVNITSNIYQNSAHAITGATLQSVMLNQNSSYVNILSDTLLFDVRNFNLSQYYTPGMGCFYADTLFKDSIAHSGTWNRSHFVTVKSGSGFKASGEQYFVPRFTGPNSIGVSDIYDDGGTNRKLIGGSGEITVDWYGGFLSIADGNYSENWFTGILADSSQNISQKWNCRQLWATNFSANGYLTYSDGLNPAHSNAIIPKGYADATYTTGNDTVNGSGTMPKLITLKYFNSHNAIADSGIVSSSTINSTATIPRLLTLKNASTYLTNIDTLGTARKLVTYLKLNDTLANYLTGSDDGLSGYEVAFFNETHNITGNFTLQFDGGLYIGSGTIEDGGHNSSLNAINRELFDSRNVTFLYWSDGKYPKFASDITSKNYVDSLYATAGSGTVTSFSSNNLLPLFTTSVSNSTTTPNLSFSLTSVNPHLFLGGYSSGSASAPSYRPLFGVDLPPTFDSAYTNGAGINTSNSNHNLTITNTKPDTGISVGIGLSISRTLNQRTIDCTVIGDSGLARGWGINATQTLPRKIYIDTTVGNANGARPATEYWAIKQIHDSTISYLQFKDSNIAKGGYATPKYVINQINDSDINYILKTDSNIFNGGYSTPKFVITQIHDTAQNYIQKKDSNIVKGGYATPKYVLNQINDSDVNYILKADSNIFKGGYSSPKFVITQIHDTTQNYIQKKDSNIVKDGYATPKYILNQINDSDVNYVLKADSNIFKGGYSTPKFAIVQIHDTTQNYIQKKDSNIVKGGYATPKYLLTQIHDTSQNYLQTLDSNINKHGYATPAYAREKKHGTRH
jgi:hypothetical protein